MFISYSFLLANIINFQRSKEQFDMNAYLTVLRTSTYVFVCGGKLDVWFFN